MNGALVRRLWRSETIIYLVTYTLLTLIEWYLSKAGALATLVNTFVTCGVDISRKLSEKWAHSNGKPRKVENNLKMIMPKSLLMDWLRLFKTYSLLEDS